MTTRTNNKVARHRTSAWWEALESRRLLSTFDISGVKPVALDQPQIHALFRTTANGAPLTANDGFGGQTFDVQAFLDTGTSGMSLSQETAQGLGIASSTYNGQPVTYSDVGVGGTEDFAVSQILYTALAPFTPSADVDNPNTYQTVYNQTYGPVRTEIGTAPADDLIGPLDILGMPLMIGKDVVMDPRPVDNLDNMHTFVYNPGTPYNPNAQDTDPGIPTTDRHIKLSFADFSRFSLVTPTGAPGPNLAANPFIGPDPTRDPLNPYLPPDNTPPVQMTEGTHTTTGSFLFDTGAAASFISQAEAANLHVHYKPGTYNTDNPDLVDDNGKDIPNQFVIPLGGVGGTINVAGFYADSLTLPTTEGQGIRFLQAPVLVADVSVEDPVTHDTLTLDGDFGMNFLVASADPNTFESHGGAFGWEVFDQPHGVLGLDLPGAPALPPIVDNATFYDNTLPQKLSFTFSSNVSGVSASSLQIRDRVSGALITPSSVAYDAATQTATATFNSSIDDGWYTATLVASAITDGSGNHLDGNADGTGGDNYTFHFTHLIGDVNHDGVVDGNDIGQIIGLGHFHDGTGGHTWADGDFNYDGIVDINDIGDIIGAGHFNSPPPVFVASQTTARPALRGAATAPVSATASVSATTNQPLASTSANPFAVITRLSEHKRRHFDLFDA